MRDTHILTFDLDGDARPLRLLVVGLEHGVVGLARDNFAVLEAGGDEADGALCLERLVVLKLHFLSSMQVFICRL